MPKNYRSGFLSSAGNRIWVMRCGLIHLPIEPAGFLGALSSNRWYGSSMHTVYAKHVTESSCMRCAGPNRPGASRIVIIWPRWTV